MPILQPAIERKLSSLLGTTVTFEKFHVSPLSGTLEAADVRVGDDPANPLLTIVLVRAQVSIKQALKGEIVVKSVTIEKPVVSWTGKKLPRRPTSDDAAAKDDKSTSWKFDIEKLFIIDGQATARFGGMELTTSRLLLDLKRDGADYSLTFLAEDVRRIDPAAMIGTVGATGRITNVADLAQIAHAGAAVDVTLGDLARLRFATPRIRSMQGEVEVHGKITLSQIAALVLPPR